MKQKDFKFLSQSILLEEQGLPRMSYWVIAIVFSMLVFFIGWSMLMELEEIVTVTGEVVMTPESGSDIQFKVQIDAINRAVIMPDQEVIVSVSGGSSQKRIRGLIQTINPVIQMNEMEKPSYEAIVAATNKSETSGLFRGMTVQADVIVGKKSLFEYFMGPILQVKHNALREK